MEKSFEEKSTMSLAVKVIGPEREETLHAFLLRIPGWTEERYFQEAPEMWFVEFEDGELIMHSPVSIRHQEVVRFLTILLQAFVARRQIGRVLNGPAVVRLRPGLNYEPDIFVVPAEQSDRLEPQRFSGIPPLVIEVISPGTRHHDLETKAANYRKHGVAEYWAVDPEHTALHQHLLPEDPSAPYRVTIHTHGRVESQAIPGFWIDAAWLWQEQLPDELRCLEQILTR
jgi:Uma2 family endonuclease